jgi:hypothetical protein
MGSENLSHKFAAKDPTYKEDSSKYEDKKSSTSHTSGTHPIHLSNGPRSSSSSIIKHKSKPNSKHRKLLKLYTRQLSHISTTINAIESLSKPVDNNQNKILLSNKKRVEKLNEQLDNIRNDPSKQDHTYFDQVKNDIDQLINDLKSYKMDNDNPDATNTIDYLAGVPLDVSDDENDEEKTIMYF